MPNKKTAVFVGAAILCLIAVPASLMLGAARLSLSALWQAFFDTNSTAYTILRFARLPRTIAAMLAGSALAVSGAVIQTVLHNKLASPGIIGVNAGAGLSVTICCALGVLSGWAIAASAFFGAMAAVFLIVAIARRVSASRTTVILAGVAVNAFLNALSEAVTTVFPEISTLTVDFRVGGFSAVSTVRLIPAGILILLAIAILLTLTNELDVIALGEETAAGLGISVRRMQTLFLLLAALLAGAAVSFGGLLGFIGLIVPHTVRKLVGSESKYVLPLCALGGAGFVTLSDVAARLLFAPYELPIGILMAVLGGPFFLLLLLKRKGGDHHA